MNRRAATDTIRPIRAIAMLLIVASLYLARDILIPTALAILLTFLLLPLVNRFRKWGLNRVAAVIVTLTVAGVVVAGTGYIVVNQFLDLTAKLPDYRDNLRSKIRDLRSSGDGTIAKIGGTIAELKQELTTQPSTQPAIATSPLAIPQKPIQVEVVEDGPDFGTLASTMATPLFAPLASGAITVLLLIFLLLYSEDIRERLITFAGMRQISLTTSAMDEASTRISGFLRMQAIVNASYGVLLAIALTLLGVPNALLWGVIGFLLRFIPYIGPWIAAAMPTLLTFAVFPGWARPLAVIGALAAIEFVTNMILEPWLYGNSAGISSLGVVVAAVFWAWLWGPVGMILAVPVTACLVVMGKHVPQLALLHQLFGTDVYVPAVGRLYQRLLVGDDSSVESIIKEELEKSKFPAVCDSLLLPTLCELKRDAAAGVIQPFQVQRALRILEDVCDIEPVVPSDRKTSAVLIAEQNEVDDCAARLMSTALASADLASKVVSSHALASEAVEAAVDSKAAMIVLVQMTPISQIHSRRLAKALAGRIAAQQKLVSFAAGAVRSKDQPAGEVSRESSTEALVQKLCEMSAVKDEPSQTPLLAAAVN